MRIKVVANLHSGCIILEYEGILTEGCNDGIINLFIEEAE
jgi:hypothetical protein